MNHEMVHIVASDRASRVDNFFRALFFGKVNTTPENPISIIYSYLTTPRRYSPRWYHEGIAVFLETWMAGGLGRALGGYDEMVFRTMVRDSVTIFDMLGLQSAGTKIDFQVGVNSYLYGTRFFSYLAYHYGPEKLIEWVSRTNESKGYFASQFKKVYNASIDNLWAQWIQWEHQFQQANLDSIRLYPTTSFREVSRKALGSVSRSFYDPLQRKLYAAVNYPGQVPHIAAIDVDNGEIEKICDVKGAALYYVTSLAYDQSTNTLFYTTDNNELRDLKAVDIKTGKSRMLIKDVRTGDLAFNKKDESIWGIRHYNGISTLVRIPYPYEEWNQIYSWPYGKDIYDIDISPDGALLTGSLMEINGSQKLIKMEIEKLMNGDTSYEVLYDFEYTPPANFVFTPDGDYLCGASYYSGVSNIFRYDFKEKQMDAISNCETGFFRPIHMSDDSLIVFRYTGQGFVPVVISNKPVEDVSATIFLGDEIVEKHSIVREWMAGSPSAFNIDSLTTYSGKYHGFQNIRLVSAYPIIEGYKDYFAYGMHLNFSGPIGINNFELAASYTPNSKLPEDERLHAYFSYNYWDWKVTATYNGADFHDLFGPTKMSRKGYSLRLRYKKTLLYDKPKTMDYTVNIGGWGGLEKLPDYQNVIASFDKMLFANISFNYKNQRSSLGAVDYEKGFKWQIVSRSNYVNGKFYPRIYTNFDFGIPLPINHSSIWLRSSAGKSFGERDEPFANFYFGGFGNNWIDQLHEKQYREHYSFPGVVLNDIGGTNFAKAIFEWNLPPIVFRRFGFPAFYSNWARIALFSSGIVTNIDFKEQRRELMNFGGQIDFRLKILSTLNSTFSIGYGAAVEKDRELSKEFMISLKIL